jgi:hypothetical protein
MSPAFVRGTIAGPDAFARVLDFKGIGASGPCLKRKKLKVWDVEEALYFHVAL